jgi:hypothetical protein
VLPLGGHADRQRALARCPRSCARWRSTSCRGRGS